MLFSFFFFIIKKCVKWKLSISECTKFSVGLFERALRHSTWIIWQSDLQIIERWKAYYQMQCNIERWRCMHWIIAKNKNIQKMTWHCTRTFHNNEHISFAAIMKWTSMNILHLREKQFQWWTLWIDKRKKEIEKIVCEMDSNAKLSFFSFFPGTHDCFAYLIL